MNKSQLMVTWMTILSYCSMLLYFMIKRWVLFYKTGGCGKSLSELLMGVYIVITLYFIPLFIISGFLIYTLGNKKKLILRKL